MKGFLRSAFVIYGRNAGVTEEERYPTVAHPEPFLCQSSGELLYSEQLFQLGYELRTRGSLLHRINKTVLWRKIFLFYMYYWKALEMFPGFNGNVVEILPCPLKTVKFLYV